MLLVLGPAALSFGQELPKATRLWTVGPLAKSEVVTGSVTFGPGGAKFTNMRTVVDSQTGLDFLATTSVVFVSDRIVLASRAGTRNVEGRLARETVYEVFSLDAQTGEVRDRRDFPGPTGQWLRLFATNDSHVIIAGASVLRDTPNLKDDGSFDYRANGHDQARVESISPDGSTLGYETSPGFQLVRVGTLEAREVSPDGWGGSSINDEGYVSNIRSKEYPHDPGIVIYVDSSGSHLLYHGKCGGFPRFLTNDLILEPGCKSPLIMDTHGKLIRELAVKGNFAYAGVSQNGKRFALQVASFTSEHKLKHERFVIYSTETGDAIADVTPDEQADVQSWTAFSPDGSMFVVGSPLKLTLYRLP